MTNRELLQSQWRVVAESLRIELIAPFHIQLPDGSEHEFTVLLPQFGAPRGMLIDPGYSRGTIQAVGAVGFAFSSMEPETHPLHLPVKAANYIKCLVDWQWTSKEQFPDWYASAV